MVRINFHIYVCGLNTPLKLCTLPYKIYEDLRWIFCDGSDGSSECKLWRFWNDLSRTGNQHRSTFATARIRGVRGICVPVTLPTYHLFMYLGLMILNLHTYLSVAASVYHKSPYSYIKKKKQISLLFCGLSSNLLIILAWIWECCSKS